MGAIGARRLHELSISRRRSWRYIANHAAKVSGATSSSTSNDTSCEETSSWTTVGYGDERSVEETHQRLILF